MYNPPPGVVLMKIPHLHDTENIPAKDKLVHVHFYFCGMNTVAEWFIVEYNGKDTFFGYVILGDLMSAEWEYIYYPELKNININGSQVTWNENWAPMHVLDVPQIHRAYLYKGFL